MLSSGIMIPTLLWLSTSDHVLADTSPHINARRPQDLDEPVLNSLLLRQEPISTTAIITTPLPSPITTTTTLSSITTTTTTKPRTPNHNIAVAPQNISNPTLPPTFHPATLKNVLPGDTLTFYFYPTNYSILQSSYALPCQPLSLSGTPSMFSGWHPTGSEGGIARSKFVVTVGSTESIWIYGVDGATLGAISDETTGTNMKKTACELGLVMVVNPVPKEVAAGATLSHYRDAAAGLRTGATAMKDKEGDVLRSIRYVPLGISGGEVMGVSDREKSRWEGRHKGFGGEGNGNGNGNGTAEAGAGDEGDSDGTDTSGDDGNKDRDGSASASRSGIANGVAGYKSSGSRGKKAGWNVGGEWMGVLVVLGVGVLGLVV